MYTDIGIEAHELEMNAAFNQWEELCDTTAQEKAYADACGPVKEAIQLLYKAAAQVENASEAVAGFTQEDKLMSLAEEIDNIRSEIQRLKDEMRF